MLKHAANRFEMPTLITKQFRLMSNTHNELDLTRQEQVEEWFEDERPDYVFLAAAKVGGGSRLTIHIIATGMLSITEIIA